MLGQTSLNEKETNCTAAIATAFTIAKFGANDDTMSVADAATDGLIGIFQHTQATAGARVRVMLEGISRIVLGGTVTRGDLLTSDAAAKGITATLGQNYVGVALASGVASDIIPVLLSPGILAPSPSVDGLPLMGVARATWDFAVDGGAVSTIGLGVTMPDNAIIVGGILDIVTGMTSAGGGGTIALNSEGAGDLLAAVDADTLSGLVAIIPVWTAATSVKMTSANELQVTIAVEALTAGKFVLFAQYVVSD